MFATDIRKNKIYIFSIPIIFLSSTSTSYLKTENISDTDKWMSFYFLFVSLIWVSLFNGSDLCTISFSLGNMLILILERRQLNDNKIYNWNNNNTTIKTSTTTITTQTSNKRVLSYTRGKLHRELQEELKWETTYHHLLSLDYPLLDAIPEICRGCCVIQEICVLFQHRNELLTIEMSTHWTEPTIWRCLLVLPLFFYRPVVEMISFDCGCV